MPNKRISTGWLFVVAPSIVFIIHMLLFRGWIVDDAGITFAYARNFAAGYGLVSQPGMPPIEGYSNFLWMIFLVPLYKLGIFHLIITPKLISIGMIVGAFAVIYTTLKNLPAGRMIALVTLLLTSLNSSFVIWTTSGLENPLYVLLICLLFYQTMQIYGERKITRWSMLVSGILAAAIAMTRPDGLLFFGVIPFLGIVSQFSRQARAPWRSVLGRLAIYVGFFAIVFGSFMIFRLLYFHDMVPNTFYAKGGAASEISFSQNVMMVMTFHPLTLLRIANLMGGAVPPTSYAALVIVVVMTAGVLLNRQFTWKCGIIFTFLVWTLYNYLLLPIDWMGEYRFATPFFVVFYAYLVIIFVSMIRTLIRKPLARSRAFSVLAVLAVSTSLVFFGQRSTTFANVPTVPLDSIASLAKQFNGYADQLAVSDGSLLTPDLGGMVYYSNLKVYDLAGLTDKTIAKTLGEDQSAFYAYIFQQVKPTFIETHGAWTNLSHLTESPAFEKDYVPICQYVDPWIKQEFNKSVYSGRFVRKAVVENKQDVLIQIQTTLDTSCNRKPG